VHKPTGFNLLWQKRAATIRPGDALETEVVATVLADLDPFAEAEHRLISEAPPGESP
jgi:hypothetical protein